MTTSALPSLHISTGSAAAVLVALAMGTSSVVFSEPAIADVLMLGVIVGLPILGAACLGPFTAVNLALWLVIVAAALLVTPLSTNMDTAVIHQLVTLFLALGAAALAGFIAADPAARFRLVMNFYTIGCLIACLAAFVGYFDAMPGTYDLFTNYGRARGTFKDPNVLGAALAPALTYCAWCVLRSPPREAFIAGATALIIALTLLITFSRGAWLSAALSLLVVAWFGLVTARAQRDIVRYATVAVAGVVVLLATIGAALQIDKVSDLFAERASLDQSYDHGPEGRFGGQRKAAGLALEHPFGIGTHTFRDSMHPEEAHNVYLTTFLNAGWLGGLLYILSVMLTLVAGFRGALRATPLQGPFIISAAAFLGLAVEGLIIDTDHWRHFFVVMALIWGLADARQLSLSSHRSDTNA